MPSYLNWPGIIRLGLVQTSLGGIVVLATTSFNGVMVKELKLAASLPGLLFGIHMRPRCFARAGAMAPVKVVENALDSRRIGRSWLVLCCCRRLDRLYVR